MRIVVWRTGHEIADRVAEAVKEGLPDGTFSDSIRQADVLIAYGILRGTDGAFRETDRLGKRWFNIDRGYFKPGHYDGYYRISLRGTQHTQAVQEWMLDETRLNALKLDVKPWRGFDTHKPVLVIPPTEMAYNFFRGTDDLWWWFQDTLGCYYWKSPSGYQGTSLNDNGMSPHKVRWKDDLTPINFSDYNYVLTFNSSVGWQALQAGIPCVSDPKHSFIGSWFAKIPLDELADAQYRDRYKLFAAMSNLQLTLQEMRQGMLWPLLQRLLGHD